MMDFFNRRPPYREARATPRKPSTGLFSDIWCLLFGDGTAVCYRCKDDDQDGAAAAPTVAPRRWSGFGSTPAYKTARKREVPAEDSSDTESPSECPDGGGDGIQEIYIE